MKRQLSKLLRTVLLSLFLVSAASAQVYPGLDGRIIDAHGHLGAFAGYDLSLQTMLAEIEKAGVEQVLVSNIDGASLDQTADVDEVVANERALAILREYQDVLRGIVWTRPSDGSAETVAPFLDVKWESGERAFVALKIHPEMNQFPADDPRVDPYLKLAKEKGVPAVFHCGKPDSNSDPARILAAARRHPDVPIVLYHMGFGKEHEPAITAVRKALDEGVDLYLGTAQADPDAVVQAVRTLGAERVLFGTDAVYYGEGHYDRYVPMIEKLSAELTAEEAEKVLRGNALRVFQLER